MCQPCIQEYERLERSLKEAIEKAKEHIQKTGVKELVIVRLINSSGYTFREPGHESLSRLQEHSRVYADQ